MNRHIAIYGLYCLGVVLLGMMATRDGYSPFATAGARGPMMFGSYGPTHQ